MGGLKGEFDMENVVLFVVTVCTYLLAWQVFRVYVESKPINLFRNALKTLAIVSVLSLPINIGGNIYTVAGNATGENVYSLLSFYQKAERDAFSVVSLGYQNAGRSAISIVSLGTYKKALTTVTVVGVDLYEKAGDMALMAFGAVAYQNAGSDAVNIIAVSLYQKSEGDAINCLGLAVYQKAQNDAGVLIGLAGVQNAGRNTDMIIGASVYQRAHGGHAAAHVGIALYQVVETEKIALRRAFGVWTPLKIPASNGTSDRISTK